jgi:hypothetical protein
MYYTTIPLVSERPNGRRWDAAKLRELRKRMDSNTMTVEEVDQVAADFLDGEIVDLASDWLGNTVRTAPSGAGSLKLTHCSGRAEAVRKVLAWPAVQDAREAQPARRHDRHPQERNVGGAKDH